MKQLLNNQMLDVKTITLQQNDILTMTDEMAQEQESEIENGNLQDYLEIYGEQDDIL